VDAGRASHALRTLRGAGALEVDLSWGQRAAAAALEPRALSLAAGPRWFLAALAPRVWQPRRGLSLQARRRRPAADQGSCHGAGPAGEAQPVLQPLMRSI